MDRLEEVQTKIEALRALMAEEELDSIVLGGATNFSWITGGGDDVVALASERGAAAVVITMEGQFVVCDNIEAGRISAEEISGIEFDIVSDEWHKDNFMELLERAVVGEVAADGTWLRGASDFNPEINHLRWSLLEPEIERYRALGADVSRSLSETAREIEQGWTEHEIAGLLDSQCCQSQAPRTRQPMVALAKHVDVFVDIATLLQVAVPRALAHRPVPSRLQLQPRH